MIADQSFLIAACHEQMEHRRPSFHTTHLERPRFGGLQRVRFQGIAMLVRFVVLLFLFTAEANAAAADQQRPLSVEDALGQLAFAPRVPIDVSADGQYVAYTLEDPRRRESAGERRFSLFSRTGASVEAQACDVWITRLASGESKNLTGGQGTNWGPVWSPSGRTQAFYSERSGPSQLWIWTAAMNQSRPVAEIVVHPGLASKFLSGRQTGRCC